MISTEQQQFVEDVGLFFEQAGLPRSVGRILGWLLIADPPHQTMPELVEALQLSKSSVSTATRTLIQFGMLERVSFPGERKDYYRLRPNVWKQLMEQRLAQTRAFRELAARGLTLLKDEPPERRCHLQGMHDLYAFFEQTIADWLRTKKTNY